MLKFLNYIDGFVSHDCPGYIIIACIILLVLGLPWLFIAKRIHNTRVRRFVSSLILALAFAPGVFGGDVGAFIVPAAVIVVMPLTGDFVPLINFIISVLTILIFFSAIYAVWVGVAVLSKRRN